MARLARIAALLLVAGSLGRAWAEAPREGNAARTIRRLEDRIRRQASRPMTGAENVQGRTVVRHGFYAGGGELLLLHPAGSKGRPRGVVERAVHLTARHLSIPASVAPPVAKLLDAQSQGWYGMPWIKGLRKLSGSSADPTLHLEVQGAIQKDPSRIDWESVHTVLVLDYVTQQGDRHSYNVFFRERRGKLAAVAVDNELAFGHGGAVDPRGGPMAQFVTWAASSHPDFAAARTLSPRLRRGLQAVDVEAWKADLAAAGLEPHRIEAAVGRLRNVQTKGLAAVLGDPRFAGP